MGFFDKIQDSITSATEQTKAKAQDVQLKREKGQKLGQLGEQVYNLFLNGQLANQELAPACQEIADLDRRIAEAVAAAAAARPQPVQPPGAPGGYAPPPPGAPAPRNRGACGTFCTWSCSSYTASACSIHTAPLRVIPR